VTPGQTWAVWLLALGQTLTYAGVYYAFPALLPEIEAATGWSKSALAAGPTLSFFLMAGLTPLTGRLVDRAWGGEMLVVLPMIAAAGIAGLGLAQTPGQWLALWAVVGMAQSGCLYETCFAFLTRRLGGHARTAITRVSLVAGFSGTLTFPLGAVLGHWIGAFAALAVFGALMMAVAVPANLWAVRLLRASERAAPMPPPPRVERAVRRAMGRPAFWAISAIFGLTWLDHGMLLTYVLELFHDQGASPRAATIAAAAIGPAQVLGRFVLMMNEARVDNRRASWISLWALLAAALALWLAGLAPALIFLSALCQGAGIGMLSILRPILTVDYLGRAGFGAVSGAIAVAPILATAAAPSVGALLLTHGGPAMIYAACVATVVAAIAVWAAIARQGTDPGLVE